MMKQSGGYEYLQEIGHGSFMNGDKKKVHIESLSNQNNQQKAKENVMTSSQSINKAKTSQI